MSDAPADNAPSPRDKLAESTKRARKKLGTPVLPVKPLGSWTAKAAENFASRFYFPTYREPTNSVPDERPARAWPASAGPKCEWSQVSPDMREKLTAAIANKAWPVYLYGPTGTGKTCAAACVFMGWNASARWYEAAAIVADVLRCRMNGEIVTYRENGTSYSDTEGSIRRKFNESSLVVMNDVGLRAPSDAAYEVFMTLIELRVGKPLIVTSNLAPEKLDAIYDDRITSRLLRGATIKAIGTDRRSEGATFVRVNAARPKA